MELELLQKIAHNTESKESFQIVVNDNKTRFTTQFLPHIQFKKNKSYEIALVNLETYYSFPNIDEMNNYLVYSPDSGTTWHHLQVPEGSYDITGCAVAQHCYNGDVSFLWENGNFDPL